MGQRGTERLEEIRNGNEGAARSTGRTCARSAGPGSLAVACLRERASRRETADAAPRPPAPKLQAAATAERAVAARPVE